VTNIQRKNKKSFIEIESSKRVTLNPPAPVLRRRQIKAALNGDPRNYTESGWTKGRRNNQIFVAKFTGADIISFKESKALSLALQEESLVRQEDICTLEESGIDSLQG
jgi:hypothetical protein